MLVAIPPRYKDTTFVVPDDVVAIGCGAFCGSNIEILVIPGSVKIIGMVGLREMDNLKELRVPNHPIYIFWDHNYIGHEIDVSCTGKDVELSAEIKSFWYNLLVEYEYDEKLVSPVAARLKMFEKKGLDWEELSLIDNVRTYTMCRWRLGQLHGVDHWDRVYENGQKLLTPEVNPLVVGLFAYLHDSSRVEDGEDINHGARAAELIDTIRETYLKKVSDDDVELLKKACRLHTTEHKTGNPTIDACFDADRLDLWRVGIIPDPERMATEKR